MGVGGGGSGEGGGGAVPSSVPTSEALFPRRSSQHSYAQRHPRPKVRLAATKLSSVIAAVPPLEGYLPKEIPHCCQITLVVSNDAFFLVLHNHPGHHLIMRTSDGS